MKPKKYLLPFVLLLAGLLLSACTGNSATLASSWPGVTVDQNTAYVAYNQHVYAIDLGNRTEKWRYPAEPDKNVFFYSSPAITSDGHLLAGGYDHVLYNLDMTNGTQTWAFKEAKNRFIGTPLIGAAAIYAPNADHKLYAMDFTGKLLWTFETGGPLWATPVSDPDCSCLFVPSMDHYLYSVNAETGVQQWKSDDLGGSLVGTPAYGPNDLLYVGTFAREMLAIDASNGKVVWRTPTTGWVWGGPLLQDGKLYFGDLEGVIYAMDAANGTILWQLQPDGPIAQPPLLTADELYFATQSGSLIAVSLDGTLNWNQPVGGKLYTSPVISGDLVLTAPVGADALFYAYNTAGVQQWPYIIEKK
jgi:outer membrane protein assembly factor BamB